MNSQKLKLMGDNLKKNYVKFIDVLTPREQDVIRVMYFGMKDNLGLSQDYFQEVLISARQKLGLE